MVEGKQLNFAENFDHPLCALDVTLKFRYYYYYYYYDYYYYYYQLFLHNGLRETTQFCRKVQSYNYYLPLLRSRGGNSY